jgi:uncharacterized protein YbjQ (UPF0145 family)
MLGAASSCLAGDEVLMLGIADAVNAPDAQRRLDKSMQFLFGTQPAPHVAQNFGNFVVNRKTNGFAKNADKTCERAFLSALITLQARARSLGGNAVVNIESYYKKHVDSSLNEYECHKGLLMAGVALRGDVVRLGDR